jgi:hypothetical protein
MTAPTGQMDGKHRPASHPVLRQARQRGQVSDEDIARLDFRIDELARYVRHLGEQSPTLAQAKRLRIIARELERRSEG